MWEFIIKWFGIYWLIMGCMSLDNIFWISASPEYKDYKKYSFKEKLKYIILYRIKTVVTNWRDIVPGIISSFVLSLII